MVKTEAENIPKCEYITVETQRKWKVKTKMISVVSGANGTILKSFILVPAQILHKVLM
jgi:hypothetical protein